MNYIFEDKINFNTALLTALCDESTEQPENICLISHNHLDKDHVTLQCKHSFNYSDILKEVCKQKKSPCIFETQKLIKTQIKCPYCRNIQNGWLPYHPDYDKILHVNWPPSGAFSLKTCQYKIKSGKKKICIVKIIVWIITAINIGIRNIILFVRAKYKRANVQDYNVPILCEIHK